MDSQGLITQSSNTGYVPTTQDVSKNYGSSAFTFSLLFLFIAFVLSIIIVTYNLYWRPTVAVTSCQSGNNCGVGQICQANGCVEITCTADSDCMGNGICINSFCTSFSCQNGNDCPTGTACVNNNCIQIGRKCQVNTDCFELSCMNNSCVQCLTNSNCPLGQGCFNNVCRFPFAGETGLNQINYPSPAQGNGNITAPPGYFCSTNICGLTGPISCTGTNNCSSSCSFCVNSVCRCTPGQNLESCTSNSDCISGICGITELGQVCIPSGGACIANYNGTGGVRICPVSQPYCVNGLCSTTSLGAVCGATGLPPDLCNNPQSLGVIGPTGITPDGMGFFCVNGQCQEFPGQLNELCTSNSCGFIQDGILVCSSVPSQSIPQMRCVKIP